jgi:hypothetical protein
LSGRSITQAAWRAYRALRAGRNRTLFTRSRHHRIMTGSWILPRIGPSPNIPRPAGRAVLIAGSSPGPCSKPLPNQRLRYFSETGTFRIIPENKKPALSSGFATGGIPFLDCRFLCINHQEVAKSSLFSDLPEPALQYHSGQVSDLWTDLPLTRPCQHPGCGFRMLVYFHRRSSVLSR